MATSGRGRARERGRRRKKSVRKKRFAYYVGFRTWSVRVRPSDDPSATLPRWRSRREGRGSPDALCGGICTSRASADRFQHLNAQRRREKRRAISPIFRFLGKKWPPFRSILSLVVRPFSRPLVLLCHSCCKTASFISRLRDDGRRTTCAQKRENDITLARDGNKGNQSSWPLK